MSLNKTSLVTAMALAATTITATAAELKFEKGKGPFHWEDLKTFENIDLSGKTINIFGSWLSQDEALVRSVMDYFEDATGARVEYAGSDNFSEQILIDVQGGSAPNIAIFPQPGLAADLAAKGYLIPLGDDTKHWVADNYAAGQSWVNLGSFANKQGEKEFYGFFYKVDVKSLVWYSPDNFDDMGYEVPETMEQLLALSDRIVADGGRPWCIGLGSGGATGWPATDWVEDMMLRTQPPSVYDQWYKNEIPFNDPRVVNAIEAYGKFAKNDQYIDGGGVAAATTDFRDSPSGLFTVPPKCYMHRQASYAPSFFPEGTVVGEDADFFYFPAYASKHLGKPVLGAGTLWAITKDSPETRVFMDFLKTNLANEIWMAQSSFLTPLKTANEEAYATESARKMGDILLNATTFRFDGSDLMPGAIGAGAFWTAMVDYTSGASAQSVADDIQQSWDQIK